MGYAGKSDRMHIFNGTSHRIWKWPKKLIFHLVDLILLNTFIIQKMFGVKMTHFQFREQLVHDLVLSVEDRNVYGRKKTQPIIIPIVAFGDKDVKHWPVKGKKRSAQCAWKTRN
jgi:hypothetical protein